jgi:hypothetical protein
MPSSPLKQTHFQWFRDDAPPASHSPGRSEDSNLAAVVPGTKAILRIQTQHTGRHSLGVSRRLEYRRPDSNQWWPVMTGGGTPWDMPLFGPSTWFVHGEAITTQRLSTPTNPGSPGFLGGRAWQSDCEVSTTVFGPGDYTEDEWSICVLPLAPPGLDLEFRLTANGQPYERYDRYPRLTVEGYAPTELDVKTNQLMADARPLAQLQFRRDNAWWDLSSRLLFPFTITRRLRAVTTADITLENADGLLARENRVSSWNLNAEEQYDPALDENRVIRLRQGVELHPNLAYGLSYTCSPAPTRPTSGQGTELTDGGFGQLRETDDAWVGWQGTEATVTFSLSPARHIHSVAVSMLSRAGGNVLLPASASVTLIGSAGTFTAPLPVEHLRDDLAGRRQHLYGLDVNQRDVSQVVFRVTPKNGAWVCLDEVALYDASTTVDRLKTTFTGKLGDDIAYNASDGGTIRLGQVRDLSKTLADLFVEVFDHYENQPIEWIVEDLLTDARYGAGLSASDYALSSTGFVMPKWTEQNASVLDACTQLAKMIGWTFAADDDGVFALRDLEWEAQTAETTYLAGRELLGWSPSVSGINLRNRIVVKSRDARSRDLRVQVEDTQSVARYGPRLFTLFEPTLRTAPLARRLANAIKHDYSWVHPAGAGVVAGDVFMRPGQVVTVVESGQTCSGPEQLYRVEAVVHRQTGHRYGHHTMSLQLRGYRHRAPCAPGSLTATPLESAVALDWASQPEEPAITGYHIFRAMTLTDTYSQVASVTGPPARVSSLTNAQTYWFKVAAYTAGDLLGDFAGPVPCAPQSGGPPTLAEEAWQPQSLTAALSNIWGSHRPQLTWYPRLPAPAGSCYGIYRSQISSGPYSLVAACSQPGSGPVTWVDHSARHLEGDVYYEVTYYDPGSDFESWPSSWASVHL